jgi:hypothetical protein
MNIVVVYFHKKVCTGMPWCKERIEIVYSGTGCIFPELFTEIELVAQNLFISIKYVGFEVLTAVVMNSSVFWDVPPCSPLKVNRQQSPLCLPPDFMLVSCLAYSLTPKMEVICSSKMSVDFQQAT